MRGLRKETRSATRSTLWGTRQTSVVSTPMLSSTNIVLPYHLINTTQPSTISSLGFPCPVRELQHITFNQPSEPYVTSELSSPSRRILHTRSLTINRSHPPQMPSSSFRFGSIRTVFFPRGRSTCKNKNPPGYRGFPPGKTDTSEKKILPGGKTPDATVSKN